MGRAPYRPPPPLEAKVFTAPQIEAGIRNLQRRIDELKTLESDRVTFDDARVDVAESNIRNTIREVFGPTSPEFDEHQYHDIWKGPQIAGPDFDAPRKFAAGIGNSITILTGLISRLEEKRSELTESSVVAPAKAARTPGRRVFLVHGHDEGARQSVARFLEQLRLEPVVLSERPNEGRTIIEKFEHHADVEYAVVLLTPDDQVADGSAQSTKARARQNVILELGYFIGRLTRRNVCALYKGPIDLPSDLHGVLYVPLDEGDGWKLKLATEMKSAKVDVDLNLVMS